MINAVQCAVPRDLPVLERFVFVAIPWLTRARDERTEAKRLTATRDSMLPRRVSGQLGVSDVDRTVTEVRS